MSNPLDNAEDQRINKALIDSREAVLSLIRRGYGLIETVPGTEDDDTFVVLNRTRSGLYEHAGNLTKLYQSVSGVMRGYLRGEQFFDLWEGRVRSDLARVLDGDPVSMENLVVLEDAFVDTEHSEWTNALRDFNIDNRVALDKLAAIGHWIMDRTY